MDFNEYVFKYEMELLKTRLNAVSNANKNYEILNPVNSKKSTLKWRILHLFYH